MSHTHYSALVITELFAPTKGGTAVWFDQVYRHLGGRSVHILTAATAGDAAVDAEHPNSIHRVNLQRVAWLRPESLAIYLRLLWSGFKIAWRHRPRQYHAGRVLPEGLIALVLARLFGQPCLIYAHGEEITTWRTPIKSWLMRWTYRHCDMVIANSRFTAERLVELGVDPQRIRLIHPGVMIEDFTPRGDAQVSTLRDQLLQQGETLLMLSVGRLSRRKGFDTMIKVTGRLRKQGINVHYAIAGIGEDQDYLQKLVDDQQLCPAVSLLGAVEAEQLPLLYQACDLFVMPNREVNGDVEGFGMVYLEAAACGKTSVSGTSGGVVSAVLHEQTGLNCDGDSVDAVYDGVYRLLMDERFRSQLADSAQQRAHTEFSWEAVASKTAAIFGGTDPAFSQSPNTERS
ncbi:glycosyltransferase family 4 protein [Aestuariirhabdus litorea]|uniref:Glycosyltransferase family 4 protein n=1 Tax=Aestuariirhabdus litorea TaxID=2528527 RepID=A0A3P3VPB9_9GAMM|nr:glycosyltransferase family 4 protein [Aestuariirhabdus litorea]RRJ84602.1 glycosyltransferase family 4 protein [Aestuariirhabdus litorea]RWW97828.1 glycosyltransferase [Endozoicomonadaceae bacterium GTF-13]